MNMDKVTVEREYGEEDINDLIARLIKEMIV